jgi:putative redox protein
MTMFTAEAKWTKEFQFAATANSGHTFLIDGDSKVASSPMELVLAALCGCTGYDVVSILQKKREPFMAVEVIANAEKASQPPRVYTAIEMLYRVRGKVSRKAVEDAVRLSKEKYCSVSAMLGKVAKISYRIELDEM